MGYTNKMRMEQSKMSDGIKKAVTIKTDPGENQIAYK